MSLRVPKVGSIYKSRSARFHDKCKAIWKAIAILEDFDIHKLNVIIEIVDYKSCSCLYCGESGRYEISLWALNEKFRKLSTVESFFAML